MPSEAVVDAEGVCSFDLASGQYRILAAARAFCDGDKKRFIDLSGQPNLQTTIQLQVASCPGPCNPFCIEVTPLVVLPEVETIQLEISVPLQTLTNLTLPFHRPHRRFL